MQKPTPQPAEHVKLESGMKPPRSVQLVRLLPVLQAWHSLLGFLTPWLYATPPITQPSKQVPWKQTLLSQTLPHAPQLALSLARFTQACPGQHVWPPEQGVPLQFP
jgi:hypothetical protein